MKRLLLCILLPVIFSQTEVLAQDPDLVGSVVHTRHRIVSAVLNEERTILVRVPVNYAQTEERYPVIYMLDGHSPQNGMMAGIIDQQAWGAQMPEMILVSIQNTNRSRDMTPTDDGKGGTVGGGDRFLEFIGKELIPFIEKNYRTQPYRIFAGHSLGGLIVLYSFVSHPELFNAYIAASPDLNYDDEYVVGRFREYLDGHRKFNNVIFAALGDEPEYEASFRKLKKLLEERKPDGLDFEFREMPDENHSSEVLRTYYWGLRRVFKGWVQPKTGTVADLEDHYRGLSKKYGYRILIPENTLNRIGYQLMQQDRLPESIAVFIKNSENHPGSSNVYDSLGEAYEKNNQLELAKENYAKAYQIAVAKSETRFIPIFKKNLERVERRIK